MLRTAPAIGEREDLNGKQEGDVKCRYSERLQFRSFQIRFQDLESSQLDCQALRNRDRQGRGMLLHSVG